MRRRVGRRIDAGRREYGPLRSLPLSGEICPVGEGRPVGDRPAGRWRRRILGSIAAGALLCVVAGPVGLLVSRPAEAFGIGKIVFDPANFAEAVKSVVEATKMAAGITQQLTMITRLVNAFGENGPLGGLMALAGAASEYGLLEGGDEARDALGKADTALKAGRDLYSEVSRLGDATRRLGKAVGQAGAWSDSAPRFPGWDVVPTLGHYGSTTGSRAFSYEYLGAWSADNPLSARLVEERGKVEKEVGALELHAISLFNGYTASQASERNRKLLDMMQSAKNSREQTASQTAVLLAILEEIQRMNLQLSAAGRNQAGQILGDRQLLQRLVSSDSKPSLWLGNGGPPATQDALAKAILPEASLSVAP